MAGILKIHDVLPKGYGYIALTATGSIVLNMWLVTNVNKARIQHNIQAPIMYSSDNNEFNSVQRAHQNYLEFYPQFILTLLLGGLQLPKLTAAAGVIYLIGRVLYAKSYYTTGSGKHPVGKILLGGSSMAMLASTLCFAANSLECKNWHEKFQRFQ